MWLGLVIKSSRYQHWGVCACLGKGRVFMFSFTAIYTGCHHILIMVKLFHPKPFLDTFSRAAVRLIFLNQLKLVHFLSQCYLKVTSTFVKYASVICNVQWRAFFPLNNRLTFLSYYTTGPNGLICHLYVLATNTNIKNKHYIRLWHCN